MRIGCLQFAPQVADIDNNLNRADAVLAKANQDDLDSLDLLVLPEMAFTGTYSARKVPFSQGSERHAHITGELDAAICFSG